MYNPLRKQLPERLSNSKLREPWELRTLIPRNWLIAEYLLNWSSVDTSGGWLNGTDTAMAYNDTEVWYQKQHGTFNWGTAFVSFSPNNLNSLTSGTISAWIKRTATWVQHPVLVKLQVSVSDHIQILFNTDNTLRFIIADTNCASVSTFTDWNWHHFCGTWSSLAGATWMNHYKDAVLDNSNATSVSLWNYTGANINIWNYTWTLFMQWNISNLRAYNRVLSKDEVNLLYLEWLKLLH